MRDVIIACDFADQEKLFEFLKPFEGLNPYLKLGMEIIYKEGPQLVKELHDKGLPWVKVYAVVRYKDKFVVLTKEKDGKLEYMLAGGGVDEGEDINTAIKREIKEELHIKVKVINEIIGRTK